MGADVLICTGINHQGTTAAERSACTIAPEHFPALAQVLREAGITEALWLATCNRHEWYLVLPTDDVAALHRALALYAPRLPELLATQGYQYAETAAVRHLMRVAASLDAMVVGEPQIFGQVKQAAALAQECGMIGPCLSQLLPQIYHVAKQVRSRTMLSERPVSISSIAIQLARQIFEDLRQRHVLVLGAGEMGRESTRALHAAGVGAISVANRSMEKAEAAAAECGGTVVPWERWPALLQTVDIVLCSVPAAEATGPQLTTAMIRAANQHRRNRPLFIIDIAMPCGVEAGAGELSDVYVYGLDDLQALSDANRTIRAEAMREAETLVEQAVRRYGALAAPPDSEAAIRALHQKCEHIRVAECTRTLQRLGAGGVPDIAAALDACSRAIVTKILHEPAMHVRQAPTPDRQADSESAESAIDWLRRLFGLGSV